MNNMGSCVTASVSYANWPKQAFTTAQYNPTPGAVANALVGEKSINNLTYAVTGDVEVDFIAGIMALMEQGYMPDEAKIRCLSYVIERLGGKPTDDDLRMILTRMERLEKVYVTTTTTADKPSFLSRVLG